MNYRKSEAADLLRETAASEKDWAWNDRLSFMVNGVLHSYSSRREELSDDDLELLAAGRADSPAQDPFKTEK